MARTAEKVLGGPSTCISKPCSSQVMLFGPFPPATSAPPMPGARATRRLSEHTLHSRARSRSACRPNPLGSRAAVNRNTPPGDRSPYSTSARPDERYTPIGGPIADASRTRTGRRPSAALRAPPRWRKPGWTRPNEIGGPHPHAPLVCVADQPIVAAVASTMTAAESPRPPHGCGTSPLPSNIDTIHTMTLWAF